MKMVYWFQVTGTSQVPVTLAQIFIEEQLYYPIFLEARSFQEDLR